jgi:hypothetical protein
MQQFVKIANRESYTSHKKAMTYVERGLAEVTSVTDNGRVTEIKMLDAAHIALSKTLNRSAVDRTVTGSFGWFNGESGGSSLMKSLEGVSGGIRVKKARHYVN